MLDEREPTTDRKTTTDEEDSDTQLKASRRDVPKCRFIGRSAILRQGVTHLCTSPSLPTKTLIVGENGSGKTALALQLLQHENVRPTFGDGAGCWYIDCAPFYGETGRSGGGAGVALILAILEELSVELRPTENEILGFLYNKLVALGSKTRVLLVLDGLDGGCLMQTNTRTQGLTLKRVLRTLASIYCVSLVVVTCSLSMRQLLPWTLVLPGNGTLGPLELNDAVDMFEEISREEPAGERKGVPSWSDGIVELFQIQPANRLPLGVTLLARMQKFHHNPSRTLRYFEESFSQPETTCTSEGLTLVFDILLRSVVEQTDATRDVMRLMRLLAFLPEALADHKKVLLPLTSDKYFSFDGTLGEEGLVEMLTKTGLAEKRMAAEGAEGLVVSQSIKKYFRHDPEEDSSLADDLNTLVLFIDRHCAFVKTQDVALALGAPNIYHVLNWLVKRKPDHASAHVAYEACFLLVRCRSSLDEGLLSNIRRVHEASVAEAEERVKAGGGEEAQHDVDKERRRLVDFLLDYSRLLEVLSMANKTRQLALEAESLAKQMGDERRIGEALIAQGQAAQIDDRLDDFYASNERASRIFEALGSELECQLARALHGMAYAQRLKGHYEDSHALDERACELFKQHGEQVYHADAIYGLGVTYKMIGKYDKAMEKYEEVLSLSAKNGNITVAASSFSSMGMILVMTDRPAEAMEKFEESYRLFKQVQSQVGMARALDNIGEVLRGMKKFEEAMEKNREAYTILKSFGDLLGMGNALDNWGHCLKELDKKQEAANKFQEALNIFEHAGLRRSRANSMFNLAEVLFLLERDDDSITAFQEAGNVYSTLGVDSMAATCKWQLGIVYEFTGSNEQAAATFKQAYEIYEKLGNEDAMSRVTDKLQFLNLS